MPTIITTYVNPPIPARTSDWSAIREGTEEGGLVGRGQTELQSIRDLIDQESE